MLSYHNSFSILNKYKENKVEKEKFDDITKFDTNDYIFETHNHHN
jgi:hypothetical protein